MRGMTAHLTILTGASRGLGLALAQQLLQPGDTLLGLSRHINNGLVAQAHEQGATLLQWSQDLADGAGAALRLAEWLAGQPADRFASATLINNAGVIPRIAPLSEADAEDLAHALRVGLEAPMLLTAAFLKTTGTWPVPRKVLNISSGLGRRPMASQAGYCAAKAGMDHFTRCLALEEELKPNGARVCALAPGVIDTAMQVQLRAASEGDFPDRDRFIGLQEEGLLSSPEQAATRVLAWLQRPDFGDLPVADVRD